MEHVWGPGLGSLVAVYWPPPTRGRMVVRAYPLSAMGGQDF